jgi:hypothetical protein
MPEFLKNKYFVKEKSPSYILVSENEYFVNFVKGKSPSFARILKN